MHGDTFEMLAGYNRWANRRLYDAVATLPAAELYEDRRLFFGSIHATLNHILVADRIWLKRFTGTGEAPSRLDAILFVDFGRLHDARKAEDDRIATWIGSLDEAAFFQSFTYRPITNPRDVTQPLAPVLFHFFNHQTHHRGQCHAALTGLRHEAPSLDMIAFQREIA